MLKGRCDSFVVETDVHFPTDINLLWDAIRKAVESGINALEVHGLDKCPDHGIKGFKQ